jgi:hypothetical protein
MAPDYRRADGAQARPLKPAVEGGFTLDDFSVDENAGTVTLYRFKTCRGV